MDLPSAPPPDRLPDAPRAASWPLWKRWTVAILGWLFILLGIAGLVLPFLQGILFLVIGLALLSTVHAWAHRLNLRLRRRFPALDRASAFAERKLDAVRARLGLSG